MAVPGENREGTFCARCYAHLSGEQAYCPECGAPTGEATPAAESRVHGELAQANLLRLRGDLAGSEKALLAILRRLPNDPHAHEMLGDVCAERGEPEQAIEWYELALDLAPNSPDVRQKLQETRDGIDARETADAAETLGLPSARSSTAWWPLAASGALVVLAVLIAAWPRSAPPRLLRETVVAPSDSSASTTQVEPTPKPTPTPDPTPPPTTSASGTEEDQKLLADIQARAGATHVQTVSLDPRSQGLEVTFEIGESDDPKAIATALGKEALAAAPTAMTTSLRAVHGGKLVFAADLARSAMASPDPLTNLWPSNTTNATPPATTQTTGGTPTPTGSTGTATTGGETPASPPESTGTAGAGTNGSNTTNPKTAGSGVPASGVSGAGHSGP